MTARHAASLALALAIVAGCGDQDLTQITVAVDTDLTVPEELDAVRIDVAGSDGELRRASGPIGGAGDLPATLGVVHRGGPLGPVRVTVTGRLMGRDLIQRSAEVDFLPDRVVVLRLWLERACLGVSCGEDQTCSGGTCRPRRVEPDELEPYAGGTVGRIDGGFAPPPDAGGGDGDGGGSCAPSSEECNGEDDDCDGEVDDGYDLGRDPDHCGECGRACPEDPPNAAGVCADGECVLLCDPGWTDCDEAEAGCEALLSSAATCGACDTSCGIDAPLCADLGDGTYDCVAACGAEQTECDGSCVDTETSPRHCGDCGTACPSAPHATAACAGSTCGYLCDEGFHDCDDLPDNGCESRLRELGSCGGCGVRCEPPEAVPSCASGTCEIVDCAGAREDCNGRVDDGCEADLATSVDHCGGCEAPCPDALDHATPICSSGRCAPACDAGWADCNGTLRDGCEASLATEATCGSCGIRCEGSAPVCAGTLAGGFGCAESCGPGGTPCAALPDGGVDAGAGPDAGASAGADAGA